MKFVACFVVHSGKILTLKRSETEVEAGKYGLIGGGVDQGESAIDSMVRELSEEVKLHVDKSSLVDLGNHKQTFHGAEVEVNCYKLVVNGDFSPRLDADEAESFEWVTLDQLLAKPNLVAGLREVIERLIALNKRFL